MLRQHVDSGADVTVGCLEMPRAESIRLRHHACRRERLDPAVPREAQGSAADAGQARRLARQHGHLRVRYEIPVRPAASATPRIRTPATISARTSSPISSRTAAPSRISSRPPASAPAAIPAPTGAMSARSMPIGRPISTSPTSCRSSTCYDRAWPIWTYAEITPPAKFVHDEESRRGQAVSSLVSGGCIISGASLRRSLLFTGVRVNSYANVENAVIMPYVECRPRRALEERRDRPRRARSRRGSSSARTRSSTPSASAPPSRASRSSPRR